MIKFTWLSGTDRRKNRTIILSAFILTCILFSNGGIKHETVETAQRTGNSSQGIGRQKDDTSRGTQDTYRENPALDEVYNYSLGRAATVIIDPGHGGVDSGTDADGIEEKDINLDIGLRLGSLLDIPGIQILFTRNTDEYISINQRVAFANKSGADLFISVHNNAFKEDPSVYGTSTLYYSSSKTENDKMNSKKLAEIVQEEMVKHLEAKDNGVFYRKALGVLRYVSMPSIIAEVGYISNPFEKTKLSDPEYRQKAAIALANAVIKALNQMTDDEVTPGK